MPPTKRSNGSVSQSPSTARWQLPVAIEHTREGTRQKNTKDSWYGRGAPINSSAGAPHLGTSMPPPKKLNLKNVSRTTRRTTPWPR